MGSSLIMMVAMVAIFYFLLIRPENKRKKKAQEMRDSISVGDKITTIGGIIGKVVHVADDRITFETGEDRVRLEVTKWAVSSNEGRGADKETTDSEETIAQ
ncbi:MAG: preprotein translocase subunit YajC [Oscillospiraceae bacterium]|nr:preprotein translocase subunit YajC [Oscillospiraceae bacterium]MBR6208944.1 preprotein translocase subunit YajC [Oscillospiraceae bacterium]